MWGSGIGFSLQGKSIYTPENFLCRFKAASFNKIPNCDDADGFVSLLIKIPFKDVVNRKHEIQQKLHQLLSSQIHSVVIEDIRPAIKPFNDKLPPKTTSFFPQPPVASIMQPAATGTVIEYTDVFIKVNVTINGNPCCHSIVIILSNG